MAFKLISAEELFYQPLDPAKAEMIIEDMIPQGLTLIAGAPKSGKSWMMLDMCLAVSSGRSFLGRKTLLCEVAYFPLEDQEERVKSRMLDLGEAPTPNLHICTERKDLEHGFLKELRETLQEHPGIRMVVIDTLQKIRDDGSGTSTANQYSKDDAEVSKLKSFADNHGIAIVCVHHLRKMPDKRDPVNEILGSAAMSSVPDQILLLKKDRRQTHGELSAIGRDSPQWRMTLEFEKVRWKLINEETEQEIAQEEIPEVLYRIMNFIRERGEWTGTASQLLEAAGEKEMQPNMLSAKISKFYYTVFYPAGITMTQKRTASERLMTLTYQPEPENNAPVEEPQETWDESVAKAKQILAKGGERT